MPFQDLTEQELSDLVFNQNHPDFDQTAYDITSSATKGRIVSIPIGEKLSDCRLIHHISYPDYYAIWSDSDWDFSGRRYETSQATKLLARQAAIEELSQHSQLLAFAEKLSKESESPTDFWITKLTALHQHRGFPAVIRLMTDFGINLYQNPSHFTT